MFSKWHVKFTGEVSLKMVYINDFANDLSGGEFCRNVRIAQHTCKDPIRNGTLGDSESRCINALSAEINSENTSKKTR